MTKKLKGKAPDGNVWCKEQWRPVGVCTGRCRRVKKCIIFKTYQEAQVDGQDVEKGKNNKGE